MPQTPNLASLDPFQYRQFNKARYYRLESDALSQERIEGWLEVVIEGLEKLLLKIAIVSLTLTREVTSFAFTFLTLFRRPTEHLENETAAENVTTTRTAWNKKAFVHRRSAALARYSADNLLQLYETCLRSSGVARDLVLTSLDQNLAGRRLLTDAQIHRWYDLWCTFHKDEYDRLHFRRRQLVDQRFLKGALSESEEQDYSAARERIDALDASNPFVRRSTAEFKTLRNELERLANSVETWSSETREIYEDDASSQTT